MKRNPDYWAKDLPSKRGFDNFDEIRMNYYRDANTMFEAFKKGALDIHAESDTGRWASGLQFSGGDRRARRQGDVQERPAVRACTASCSTRVAPVFRSRRAARARRTVRLRMDQQEPVLRRLPAHRELLRRIPNFPRSATPASDTEKALLVPYRRRVLAGDHGRHMDAAGRRTAAAATGRS